MSFQNAGPKGIFINGKEQAIELLKLLNQEERERIIGEIRIKNPGLALELHQNCFTFNHIEHLSESELFFLINRITPQILGLALKDSPSDVQRKVLGSIQREYAEEAFQTMVTPYTNESSGTKKAREKIKNIMIQMLRKSHLS